MEGAKVWKHNSTNTLTPDMSGAVSKTAVALRSPTPMPTECRLRCQKNLAIQPLGNARRLAGPRGQRRVAVQQQGLA
jgi:hypothetical protein